MFEPRVADRFEGQNLGKRFIEVVKPVFGVGCGWFVFDEKDRVNGPGGGGVQSLEQVEPVEIRELLPDNDKVNGCRALIEPVERGNGATEHAGTQGEDA